MKYYNLLFWIKEYKPSIGRRNRCQRRAYILIVYWHSTRYTVNHFKFQIFQRKIFFPISPVQTVWPEEEVEWMSRFRIMKYVCVTNCYPDSNMENNNYIYIYSFWKLVDSIDYGNCLISHGTCFQFVHTIDVRSSNFAMVARCLLNDFCKLIVMQCSNWIEQRT